MKSKTTQIMLVVGIVAVIIALLIYSQKKPTGVSTTGEVKVGIILGFTGPIETLTPAMRDSAKLAFKEAAKAAKAVIMEPIMKLEVITPEENMGDIVGDLNRRRGQVNSMDDRAGAKVVAGEVPLSEMFGYVTSLRTLSSGRATSTMEFSHYAETPSNISESVISEIKGNTQEE